MIELLKAARNAHRLGEMAKENPLKFFSPSPPQLKVLQTPHSQKIVLFRAGNQLGKTVCGAVEILFYMFGYHFDMFHVGHLRDAVLIIINPTKIRT